MAKRKDKKPCSITLHLAKEDFTMNFDYYEYVSAGTPKPRYKYIYFEMANEIMSKAYEKWHMERFDFYRKAKLHPCEATVILYDEEMNIKEKFRITDVLPERFMSTPKSEKNLEEKYISYVDYRYVKKIPIEINNE